MGSNAVHYEAAFEAYLRARGTPYLAIDETHKALFGGVKVKSFDFLLYAPDGRILLADVKGRLVRGNRGSSLQNWVTQDDVDSLQKWEGVFGPGYAGLFVFAYWYDGAADPGPGEIHIYEGARYRFIGLALADYIRGMRVRSPKWNTVTLPAEFFRAHAKPVPEFLGQSPGAEP